MLLSPATTARRAKPSMSPSTHPCFCASAWQRGSRITRTLVKGTNTLLFRDDKGNPVWNRRTGK